MLKYLNLKTLSIQVPLSVTVLKLGPICLLLEDNMNLVSSAIKTHFKLKRAIVVQ